MNSWTEDRVALLLKLNAEGLTAAQMAERIGGISRNAVIGKVNRLGLVLAGSRARTVTAPGQRSLRSYTASAVVAARRARAADAEDGPKARAKAVAKAARENRERWAAEPEAAGACTMLTLGAHSCRWPIGDPSADGFTLCGLRRAEPSFYCAKHAALSVLPFTGRGASAFAPDLARALRGFS